MRRLHRTVLAAVAGTSLAVGGFVTAPAATADTRTCSHNRDGVGHYDNILVYWIDYYRSATTKYEGSRLTHKHKYEYVAVIFGGQSDDGVQYKYCSVHSSAASASVSTRTAATGHVHAAGHEHASSEGYRDRNGVVHHLTAEERPAWVRKALVERATQQGHLSQDGRILATRKDEERPAYVLDLISQMTTKRYYRAPSTIR